MKYKISVAREIVVDIDSEALVKLEGLYRADDWDNVTSNLIEKACADVESVVGIPVGDPNSNFDEDTIYAVKVAENDYPIIEW